MKEILYIPGIGLKFYLSKIAFAIGPLKVHWYGILLTLGFMCGMLYALSMSKKFNIKNDDVIDIVLGSLIGGIIGARIYYVIFSFDLYRNDIVSIFKIWEGGIAIYGGIIGAFLVGIVLCKKKKIKVLPMSDLIVGGLLIGQSIGRWGNFVNIEAFGRNTNLPWGMTSISIQRYLSDMELSLKNIGVYVNPIGCVHPCFLYESIWCLIGFGIILFLTIKYEYSFLKKRYDEGNNILHKKRVLFEGELTLIYFIWYGIGRCVIEGLRVDSLMLGNIKVSQLLSLSFVVLSVFILVLAKFNQNHKKNFRIKKCEKEQTSALTKINSVEEILKKFSDDK